MQQLRRFALFLMAFGVLAPLVAPLTANASSFGGLPNYGYFYGIRDTRGSDVIRGGVFPSVSPASTTGQAYVESFISIIAGQLSGGTVENHTGAAFIVLTMLGESGKSPKNDAFVRFNEWATIVRDYATKGWIGWYKDISYSVNTLWQGSNGGGPNPDDDSWFNGNGFDRGGGIIFHNPDGSVYTIRVACGNPVGNLSPLQKQDYSAVPSIAPGSSTPAFGGTVRAGSTYRLTPSVFNMGPANTGIMTLLVGNLNPAYSHIAGINSSGAYTTSSGTLTTTALCSGYAPQCWYWGYTALPAGATSTQTNGVVFTVDANTPDNTSICFNTVVGPSNSSGAAAGIGPFCFTVLSPHYPAINATNGDVHAGGGLCAQPQSTGSVTGNTLSQSQNQYVVSANGSVAAFGSNGSAGGTSATLGQTGGYYSICRPDLVAVARAYLTSGQPYTALPGGTYTMASLPPSANGIYIHNGGGDITLSGSFSSKITIVALTDNVIISGNITLSGTSANGKNVPSLGIIAANDIIIHGAATRIDAYLFANGVINTCVEGATAACRNTLTVNGFLMGRTVSFKRFGPSSGATPIGEQVNLTGQLYLNPPKFFDTGVNANLLQDLGEKPPIN